jgi:hypothetical protein
MKRESGPDRRRLLKIATVGGATSLLLPNEWTKPVVKSVIVPAHAAASPHENTTARPTTPPPTTPPPTTTPTP